MQSRGRSLLMSSHRFSFLITASPPVPQPLTQILIPSCGVKHASEMESYSAASEILILNVNMGWQGDKEEALQLLVRCVGIHRCSREVSWVYWICHFRPGSEKGTCVMPWAPCTRTATHITWWHLMCRDNPEAVSVLKAVRQPLCTLFIRGTAQNIFIFVSFLI